MKWEDVYLMIGSEGKSQVADVSKTDFEKLFEAEIKELQEGDIIKGTVVEVTKDSVMIDIGYKSEGHVSIKEFTDENGVVAVKVGDVVKVLLERRENEHGYIVLST